MDCMKQTIRTSRKLHKCCECSVEILRGNKYVYTSGVWDHSPQSFKQCMNCSDIADGARHMVSNDKFLDWEDGPSFTQLREWFFAYMCSSFKGKEFLEKMAEDCGLEAESLNLLLKIDLTED